MGLSLILKLSLFAVVLLIAMSVATALSPGADKWQYPVSGAVFVLAAIAAMAYVRKHGRDQQAEQGLQSVQRDDSGRWKMGAVVIAIGAFFSLGHLGSFLGYLMIASGAALVIQYFWLKRKRAGL